MKNTALHGSDGTNSPYAGAESSATARRWHPGQQQKVHYEPSVNRNPKSSWGNARLGSSSPIASQAERCGTWGVPLARSRGRHFANPAQLRKCRVTIGHATSWLSADATKRPSLRQGGVAAMTSQAERGIRRSGDYRKAVFLPIARHLRSCAGFTRYIKNACQRYATVEWRLPQSYNPIAPRIDISSHFSLFNLTLTLSKNHFFCHFYVL